MSRDRAQALERFERHTAWPMLILSIAIIPLLVIPLIFELSTAVETTFFALDWFIWAAFAVEYGVRLFLSERKLRFLRANVVDLVIVVVPFLRPLRVVRSARALRALRAVRVAAFLFRGTRAAHAVLTGHKLHYVLLVMLVLVVASALLVESVESASPASNIKSVPDALWWAATTVTTVGYGDRFPVTAVGRGVAVVLMAAGVGVFGLLAASMASFFIQHKSEDSEEPTLAEVVERLDRIEKTLQQGRPEPTKLFPTAQEEP
jgi:voltage-gated potassium channel